ERPPRVDGRGRPAGHAQVHAVQCLRRDQVHRLDLPGRAPLGRLARHRWRRPAGDDDVDPTVSGRLKGAGRARGFSLIELMVALALGLIVTGSALTLVMTNRTTFAATEDMGRIQENVRLAFELMGRELRSAGGNFCDSSKDVYSGLRNPGANWWSNWANITGAAPGTPIDTAPGLRGYAGNVAFPDSAFGTGVGQRVNGTDAIEVKSAVPLSADVAMVTTSLVTPFSAPIELSSLDGIAVGDLLMICNFVNASIFRVTGLGVDTVEHAEGVDDEDNLSDDLPQWTTGTPPATYGFNAGSIVARVHAARWYIGNNGLDTDNDGVADGRSLYRALLVNNAGTLGVEVDEIAQGVTDMQVGYLIEGATSYVDAASVAAWSDGGNPVVAARVTLTFQGDDRVGADGERIERNLTQTV